MPACGRPMRAGSGDIFNCPIIRPIKTMKQKVEEAVQKAKEKQRFDLARRAACIRMAKERASLEEHTPAGFKRLLREMMKEVLVEKPMNLYKFFADLLESELVWRSKNEMLFYLSNPPSDYAFPTRDYFTEGLYTGQTLFSFRTHFELLLLS